MLKRIVGWLRRAIKPIIGKPAPIPLALSDQSRLNTEAHKALLENAKRYWRAGEWQSLANLDSSDMELHPERDKLALLAGAGKAQLGEIGAARKLIRLAEDWGCTRQQIAQTLIAGTYRSLSQAALAAKQKRRALIYSRQAAALGPQPAGAESSREEYLISTAPAYSSSADNIFFPDKNASTRPEKSKNGFLHEA